MANRMSYMRDKLPSQKIFRYFEFWGRGYNDK